MTNHTKHQNLQMTTEMDSEKIIHKPTYKQHAPHQMFQINHVNPPQYVHTTKPKQNKKITPQEKNLRQQYLIQQKVQLAQATVSQATNIPVHELQAPTRGNPKSARARQIAMYLCHVALGLSLTQTGAAFGRDRTTAAHACHVIEDKRDNPTFDTQITQLEEGLAQIAIRIHT